jgi:hypothetical protein
VSPPPQRPWIAQGALEARDDWLLVRGVVRHIPPSPHPPALAIVAYGAPVPTGRSEGRGSTGPRGHVTRGEGCLGGVSLASGLFLLSNAVLVVVKGIVASGARALAEKPGDFGKSCIVLVNQDRMALYACVPDTCDAFHLPYKSPLLCHRLLSVVAVAVCHQRWTSAARLVPERPMTPMPLPLPPPLHPAQQPSPEHRATRGAGR